MAFLESIKYLHTLADSDVLPGGRRRNNGWPWAHVSDTPSALLSYDDLRVIFEAHQRRLLIRY